jgi:bis(5'-nucleosidyl)-tetraphosphatase
MLAQFPNAFRHYTPRSKKISGVILISHNNTILLVKGRKMNKWSFPKGHIEGSETIYQCAIRECFEETGISLNNYEYNYSKKLNSGEYFIYKIPYELKHNMHDTEEISDIAWVSIPSMMNMYTNTDVNAFLKDYKSYV